jgi:hypothetical protein
MIRLPAGHFRLLIAGIGEEAAATGDLDLTKSVTIGGAGARSTVVDALGVDRVFDVGGGVTASLSDLTITGGQVAGGGAGIRNLGTLTLVRDAAVGNRALGPGGGIESNGPALTITQSTIAGNQAYFGGGIQFANALTVMSSTVTRNVAGAPGSAMGSGGGIDGAASSPLLLRSSTVTGNQAFFGAGSGGGLDVPVATVQNSIVANNVAYASDQSTASVDNCAFATTSQGNNLSDGADCGFTHAGDRQGAPVLLGPLADNGGPTDTEAVLPGSAALDAGAGCPAADQRGAPRPRGKACEIGAYEVAGPLATTSAARSVGLASGLLTGTLDPGVQPTSFRFEYGLTTAYGSSTPLQWAAPGAPIPVSAFLAGLKAGTTYHFRLVATNADGAAAGADLSFVTLDRTRPVLSLLKVAPGIFRAVKGTKISLRLSEPATVTFKFDRVLVGVRRGRTCVAKTKRRRGRPCTRYLPIKGSLAQPGNAGTNSFHFDAKLGSRRLAPSAYRLSATPRDPSGNVGKRVVAAFRVRR